MYYIWIIIELIFTDNMYITVISTVRTIGPPVISIFIKIMVYLY